MTDTKDTVPCRYCGDLTRSRGTKLCDRCWELEHRIRHDPELALRIMRDSIPGALEGEASPNSELCPADIKYDIKQYLEVGQPPGNFVYQLLSNNLKESFMGADETNRRAMAHIVAYLYNSIPSVSWGSRERVREVVEAGGFYNYCLRVAALTQASPEAA